MATMVMVIWALRRFPACSRLVRTCLTSSMIRTTIDAVLSISFRVKCRQAESQGECRDGEKRCAEKRQKCAEGTLAFATNHHVQEETTGLGKDADHEYHAKRERAVLAVGRLCKIPVIKERHQQQHTRMSM